MDFSASTLWWVVAGLLVAAELLLGTFYLLMLALGAAVAALAAHGGFDTSAQLIIASVVGGGATALWHYKRASAPRSAPAESNRDVNLDIGQTVQVDAWGPDGEAQVQYRGAAWAVRYQAPGVPAPGAFVIVAVRGSRFDVAPAAATPAR
jgi:membrane protein implicated in regulation of membrane protease activity